MTALALHDAEIDGRRGDLVISDGVIAEVGSRVRPRHGVHVIDCHGGALLPGLHDHHLHLSSLVAEQESVRVGPPSVRDAAKMALVLRTAASRLNPGQWLRATGYYERVAGGLDRQLLDSMVRDVPLRVQHRTGAMWVLNTLAIQASGLEEARHPGVERDKFDRPTGRVFGADLWLRARLPAPPPLDFARVGAQLASYGVTGLTDTTPTEDPGDLRLLGDAVARGDLPQRVVVTGGVALTETEMPTSLEPGPVKLVVADHSLPGIDELADDIVRAHAADRAVAIHCVTNTATVLALGAWAVAGVETGDRIEHGSIITPDTAAMIAGCGLTVVTQPSFVHERGDDYLLDVEPADQPYLYRCGGLQAVGIGVGAGTDAPYGDPDPWLAMRAATDRRTRSGRIVGHEERTSPVRALELFLGTWAQPGAAPRRVEVGVDADLCLLAVPLADALATFESSNVRMTFRRGVPVFER